MRAEGTIAIIGGVALVIGGALFVTLARESVAGNPTELAQVVAAAPPTPAPVSVPARDGSALSWGALAYIDGRDTDATPPLTIRQVMVWTSVEQTRSACRIEHGQAATLTAVERNRKGTFARVKSGSCEGWLASVVV